MKSIKFVLMSIVFFSSMMFGQIIGHWTFNEETGLFIKDISGKNNHGKAISNCYSVKSNSGYARVVPRSSESTGITVPHSPSLIIKGKQQFTIEVIIKAQKYEKGGIALIQKTENFGLGLGSYSGAGYLQFFIWQGSGNPFVLQSDEKIPLNQWVHVAGTWDGSIANIYVNHKLVNSGNYSEFLSGSNKQIWIGRSGGSFNQTSETAIDEIRLTTKALLPKDFLTSSSDTESTVDNSFNNSDQTLYYEKNTSSEIEIKIADLPKFFQKAADNSLQYEKEFELKKGGLTKGEFETSSEFSKRIENERLKLDKKYGITKTSNTRYYVRDIGPLTLGTYNADWGSFKDSYFLSKVEFTSEVTYKNNNYLNGKNTDNMLICATGHQNYRRDERKMYKKLVIRVYKYFKLPRDKAKMLKDNISSAKCDVIFSLNRMEIRVNEVVFYNKYGIIDKFTE